MDFASGHGRDKIKVRKLQVERAMGLRGLLSF
jgi:hypothetical protein